MKIIDLRSDTVTKPSKAMLDVMMCASLGDDVYGEDPTVIKLEQMIAERAGMEAAILAPSGTQTNLMGIMSHCERGDEYIVGQTAHTYLWEGGGASVLGSVQPQPLDFAQDGTLPLENVRMAIKPIDDHLVRTKLFCLEDTTNGKVLPLTYLKDSSRLAKENKLAFHLDGSRVFNAAVALSVELNTISQHFDSISICFSKGLGAPIGSALCGNKDFIKRARRWRKVLGGGMRQAGILAAACIYALDNNIARLNQDHENAQKLAAGLARIDEITVTPNSLHTNMLFIETPRNYDALQPDLAQKGIVLPKAPNKHGLIRLVTHLDITADDVDTVIKEIKSFYAT
jgi:threonine aldolase